MQPIIADCGLHSPYLHTAERNVEKLTCGVKLYRPWRGLGLREVETPTFSDIRLTDGGNVVSPTLRPLFYPQEVSWYSFLLQAEWTPGPYCGWKD
jgi:hypothetical protein